MKSWRIVPEARSPRKQGLAPQGVAAIGDRRGGLRAPRASSRRRRPMKILTLSNCPLDEAQGSGYVIVNYARHLRLRGHQVDLLGPDELALPRSGRRAIRYRLALGMA